MKTNKLILTFLFAVLSLAVAYGQTVDLSILKFKDEFRGSEPIWNTCNDDSLFFKIDSIVFTTKDSGRCYNTFEFKIRNKTVKEIQESIGIRNIKTLNRTKGRIKKEKRNYFLVINNMPKVWRKYRIVELIVKPYTDEKGYSRKYYSMTLLRVKKQRR